MAKVTAAEKNKPARKTLRHGEYYNPKTKRYEYHYVDIYGKERVVSSYKLDKTDQLPKGKRSSKSLREKEEEITASLRDNLDVDNAKITLLDLLYKFFDYSCNRRELALRTKASYTSMISLMKRYKISYMEIGEIRPYHCEAWYNELGKSYSAGTATIIATFIRGAFAYAVDYDYIAKSPIRNLVVHKKSEKSIKALSMEDMVRFLDFCAKDRYAMRYYDMIYILFWTGVRSSELCGITLQDVDLKNRRVSINKQLMHNSADSSLIITPAKSVSGNRVIPMTDGVYSCFQHLIENRPDLGNEEPICYDGQGNAYSGFLFFRSKSHIPVYHSGLYTILQTCIRKFNAVNSDNPIAPFGPHVCRHTFATNMQHLPPKTLQYILGHSDISITMGVYVDAQIDAGQLDFINTTERKVMGN